MNAVWRLALTYFSLVPLQKWLAIAGMVMFASAFIAPTPLVVFAAVLGGIFVVTAPLVVGGMSMRHGSSMRTLGLRPGGRWKMLLAALLAIILMTAISAVAVTAVIQVSPPHRDPAAQVSLFAVTVGLWGAISLFWLTSFIASASRLWSVVITVGFFWMSSLRWAPLQALGPPRYVLAIIGAAAWLVFAMWYLRVRQVRRPGWSPDLLAFGGSNPSETDTTLTVRSASRATAIRAYLLGSASPIGLLMPGALAAGLLALMHFFQNRNPADAIPLPVGFMNMFAWIAASTAGVIARRARFLWLREGRDRSGLFAVGERTALFAGALIMLCTALLLAGYSIAVRPDMATSIVVYTLTQLVFATSLVYFGLSLTRGWLVVDIAGGIVMFLVWLAQMALVSPQNTMSRPLVAPAMLAFSVVLTLMLRRHARNRWLSLDWHLTRPLAMAQRA